MTKKKLIITITSLCLVVVAAVAAVFGIIAAQNVGFNSNLSVSYTPGAHVMATVTGKYAVNGGEEQSITNRTFNYNEVIADGDTTLTSQANITLNDTNKYVVIAFEFKNNAGETNTNSKKLAITMVDNSKATNMTYTLKKTTTQITAMTKAGFEAVENSDTALDNIGIGQTGYVYALVEIIDGQAGSWGKDSTKTGSTYMFTLNASAAA